MGYRLSELAHVAEAELHGDGECEIDRVATLDEASAGAIAFLTNTKYRKYLVTTRASAVILKPEFLAECPVNALVSDNPHLAYARISSRMFPAPAVRAGRHPSAVIADSAKVDPSAWIGACAVVEEGAEIGARVSVGPGCVVGREVRIGDDTRLIANVTLCDGVTLGQRVLLHPGVVVGSDGFGLANDDGVWVKVPQLGSVVVGDDVEIGANTTVDRGALRDTVLQRGVKLDNQIQVAHNVHIGEHTAIAACTGISGSTRIGNYCTIGGGVGITGHIEIADHTHISGQGMVTRSMNEPGYYSGGMPVAPNLEWRKNIAHLRRLDDIVRRLKALEKKLASDPDRDDQE
jgi:UDP-3-O-[3-hydroxymyristoyl] glucosamine N-acyltransferase